jgi:hypothetical protein
MEEWLRKYGVELLDWGDTTNNMLMYYYHRLSYVYNYLEYIHDNYDDVGGSPTRNNNNEENEDILTEDDVGLMVNGRVEPVDLTCADIYYTCFKN